MSGLLGMLQSSPALMQQLLTMQNQNQQGNTILQGQQQQAQQTGQQEAQGAQSAMAKAIQAWKQRQQAGQQQPAPPTPGYSAHWEGPLTPAPSAASLNPSSIRLDFHKPDTSDPQQ